ncbi:MAG: hypothetical protein C4567_07265 [Deltaproteobacteria bacterium]|nr:MAG: hypothetical protein C4567_07265 [Deltaproteobacteria bacterium]
MARRRSRFRFLILPLALLLFWGWGDYRSPGNPGVGGFAISSPPPALGAAPGPVYLRVNQAGVLPADRKIALALTAENLAGRTFSVINEPGGAPVFSAAVGPDRGGYGGFAHLYELNFSALKAPGKYRVLLEGQTSPSFSIGDRVYAGVIDLTLQFFRVQRCGDIGPALHGPCHLKDGTAQGGPVDRSPVDAAGGWHDAGDYLKFMITTGAAAVLMLTAYQRHPEVFGNASGQGLPPVLAEARIGLDWMLKMWDPARQTLYYQVGDATDHNGWRLPEGDDAQRPVRPVWACEAGKGANIAGKAAAALALAAALWNDAARPFYNPALAATYRTAAEQIYAFGKARPAAQSATSGFYTETTWRDDLALAAAELYRATGNTAYLSEAKAYALAAGNTGDINWGNLHNLAHYEIGRLDPAYRSQAAAFLKSDLDDMQLFAASDPFRAAVFRYYWGSVFDILGAALMARWYEDLTGDTAYRELAWAQRDFFLGANPWGVSWVNGLGEVWPHHPHHQVADLTQTELTGFWDEGPMNRSDWLGIGIALKDPDGYAPFQSAASVYHDDLEDYATNEPCTSVAALGLAFTAWCAPPTQPTPAVLELLLSD